jgi:tape measure domain-containing protein
VADISQVIALVFKGTDEASAAINRVEQSLQAAGKAGDATSKVGDDLEKATAKASQFGSALEKAVGFLSAGLIARAFVDANVELERFQRAMTLITGSSDRANEEFEYLKRTSDLLGLSVRDSANAYVSLSAATKGTALEGESTRRIFESVANAMSTLGRSSADTEGALLAIQQIISKGTVSSEELRGQLGERLPGAFQIAARSVGVTTQELGKLLETGQLTATEFLPRFTEELNRAFGEPARVDGYTQAINRLRNEIDEAFVALGQTGAFEGLQRAVAAISAIISGSVSSIRFFGETIANIAVVLGEAGTGDFGIFSADWTGFGQRFKESLDKAANSTSSLTEALFGARNEASAAGAQVESLGRTVSDPKLTGAQILSELKKTLKDIKDEDALNKVMADIVTKFAQGKLSADEFAKANALLEKSQDKLAGTAAKTAEELRKQAAEQRKAEEAAQRAAIELEKIASNERIKFIEARISIDVERVKAQAETVRAAFESINTTIDSTADIISKAFGALTGGDFIDSSTRNALFRQLDVENARRDRALQQQAELTQAQINLLRQQAQAMERGDALVKIDGAGLQPHLEAFMWEILKTIQVRVNRDGLGLLLGL